MTEIPFTQCLLPHGRCRQEFIDRPDDIATLAQQFIDSGGRYECETLRDGTVSLTAVHKIDGEENDIAIVLCSNGPEVPSKVDDLIHKSIEWFSKETA